MPELEPYTPSRWERIGGIKPSLATLLYHYTGQMFRLSKEKFRQWIVRNVPNPRRVFNWIALGAGVQVFFALMALHIIPADENKNARAARAEEDRKIAAQKRRDAEEAGRQARALQDKHDYESLASRATANWDQFRIAFVGSDRGVACYHGHIMTDGLKTYQITCYTGPLGQLPTTTVVCNESICSMSEGVHGALPVPAPAGSK